LIFKFFGWGDWGKGLYKLIIDYCVMAQYIIDSLRPGYSTIISKDEYYKLKDYVKRFCSTTSEYTQEDDREYREQLFFICNKELYILTYIRHFKEGEEIYSLYRPF